MIHEKRGTWWATDPKKGKKAFASEEEAKTWAAGGTPKKEETSKPEDKDLFSADAQMAVRRRRRTAKKKSVPTNKALYARVKAATKRKFAVYPSAYANAWLVREYKKRGGKYRSG